MWAQLMGTAVHVARLYCQHALEVRPQVMPMQLCPPEQAHEDVRTLTGQFTTGE